MYQQIEFLLEKSSTVVLQEETENESFFADVF